MITIKTSVIPEKNQIVELYDLNDWSAADKPEKLFLALQNSHKLVTAWQDKQLVGLGNAISDGHLVVYFPHLLVHPEYRHKGIGKAIMKQLSDMYKGFHQQVLIADPKAINFYLKCGFKKTGKCQAMWVYEGKEFD
jgi:GNAT superfamily N-acetyltransferase